MACGHRDQLSSTFVADIDELLAIELTALQPKTIKRDYVLNDCAAGQLVALEARHQFEIIDGNLQLSCRFLSEGVQEGLWMEQVTQVNGLIEKSLLLHSLQPEYKSICLPIDDLDPLAWILWSFPFGLPTRWNLFLEQIGRLLLTFGSEHLSSFQDLDEIGDTVIYNT